MTSTTRIGRTGYYIALFREEGQYCPWLSHIETDSFVEDALLIDGHMSVAIENALKKLFSRVGYCFKVSTI